MVSSVRPARGSRDKGERRHLVVQYSLYPCCRSDTTRKTAICSETNLGCSPNNGRIKLPFTTGATPQRWAISGCFTCCVGVGGPVLACRGSSCCGGESSRQISQEINPSTRQTTVVVARLFVAVRQDSGSLTSNSSSRTEPPAAWMQRSAYLPSEATHPRAARRT